MRSRVVVSAFLLVSLVSTAGYALDFPPCELNPTPNRTSAARVPEDSLLVRLFAGGRSFDEVVMNAKARKAEWTGNYRTAQIPAALIARARAVKGTWRILAVAEDWCGDSAANVPFVSRLLDSLPNVQLRVVDTTQGGMVMRSHRTWDGRAATPTFILIDAQGNEVGCFIERPLALQTFLKRDPPLTHDQTSAEKRVWYAENKGADMAREIVEMLESAGLGTPRCAGSAGPTLDQ